MRSFRLLDDEVLRLFEQGKTIYTRLFGSSSVNVAASEGNLGTAYHRRAKRANDANDWDHALANLELALPRFREAARIYRDLNHTDMADSTVINVLEVEERQRQIAIKRAATATIRG